MFIMPQQTRRSPRVYRRNADINMTNLMDVMMVLLVVFMVAAPADDVGHCARFAESRRQGAER